MQEAEGDIWDWLDRDEGFEVVIPTNIGWKLSDGANVMGAGLAKQAQLRYRGIAKWYGDICRACGPHTPVVIHEEHPLIFFPVKPLNYDEPHLSWRSKASRHLIRRSLDQLASLRLGHFAIPMVGCGNGGLAERDIYPMIQATFRHEPNVTLVRYG